MRAATTAPTEPTPWHHYRERSQTVLQEFQ